MSAVLAPRETLFMMEKLVKLMDTIRVQHGSVLGIDAQLKKKELQLTLYQLTEHLCSSGLHMHKDFPNYVGQVIDVVLHVCDSQDANVRMAGDESLTRILKVMVGLHANRVLVELCRRIKKNGSVRVMKITLARFSDLCHLIRPQKRRAYVANVLNTILLIAKRSEDGIHESLASFLAKAMPILGVYTYENEVKAMLKTFLNNLSYESTMIRRCAANCITAIAQNSRKSLASFSLVVDYLIDLINPNGNQANVSMVLLGSLMTVRLLLPLSLRSKEASTEIPATDPGIQDGKLLQIFELCLHYSLSNDHNVATAALETLQQLLKCATPATAELWKTSANCQTRATTLANTKSSSNWNLAPLTTGDESHLLENEVSLGVFVSNQSLSSEGDMPDFSSHQDVPDSIPAEWTKEPVAADESFEGLNPATANECADKSETNSAATVDQVVDIGTLWESPNILLYCSRHLAAHFLLTAEKHSLKSDRMVRVAVKNLAMSCLSLTGLLEPCIWSASVSKTDQSNPVMIIDVLQYADHPDPQLRGQCSFLAASIIKCLSRQPISTTTFEHLCGILKSALRDKAAVTCRLALQGIRLCLPFVAEVMTPSRSKTLVQLTFEAFNNPYWLVRVELLELIGEIPWMYVLEENNHRQSWECIQEEVFRLVYIQSLGNEDQRVRTAAAQSLVSFVRNWRSTLCTAERVRVHNFTYHKLPQFWGDCYVAGVQTSADNVAGVLVDEAVVPELESNLKEVVQRIVSVLVSSDCKFTKTGCIQALSTLCEAYSPSSYPASYNCGDKSGFTHLAISLMTSSHLMLDVATHQALLSLTCKLFAGNVKAALTESKDLGERSENWPFLSLETAEQASSLLSHVAKLICSLCTVVEEACSPSGSKGPLVNLPSPAVLSPIRRKTKSGERPEEKSEEFLRKWNKLGSSGTSSSLGFFYNNPLYVKLHQVIKTHHSSYKRTLDPVTCDKFIGFLKSTLDILTLLLEVATFYDIGRHSEELLSYLKVLISLEPQGTLFAVQQLLKCLFGVNLAGLWEEDTFKRRSDSDLGKHPVFGSTFLQLCLGTGQGKPLPSRAKVASRSPTKYRNSSPEKQARNKIVTKFRTVGRLGPDKSSLSSYIRIFEPMVIRALKLYTTTSCADVQREVLNLLSELVHLCVNYCLLDADQVFLNFVIQQLEFLEEGFITKVELLLPAIFGFLCLLSYDRYHSKSVIAIPRIIRICGGLIATGKDPQLYVLPALGPIVEDLFLSKERLEDRSQELDTEREVLINMMLRLIKYHKVYPLLLTVIDRTKSESTAKWNSLSKQICDSLIPVVSAHEANIDDIDAVHLLSELLCNLASSAVHESLLGLLQTFSPTKENPFVQVLAARCAVLEYLLTAYDEPFLLDCLGEFNLNYLVSQSTDPLNVSVDTLQPQFVLASVLVTNLKLTAAEVKKLRGAAFTEHEAQSAYRSSPLERVASHYVLRLVRLMDSGAFPEIRRAFTAEIADDGLVQEMCGHLKCIADFSPTLVIQMAVLLPSVVKLLLQAAPNPGLNCAVALKGLLVLSCVQQSKSCPTDVEVLRFWKDHGRRLLEILDEPQVFEYAVLVLKDPRKSDAIFEMFTFPMSVAEMSSYLRLYEAASLGDFQKQTVSLLRRIATSKEAALCSRTCDVVCSRILSQSQRRAAELEKILEFASTTKIFAPIHKLLKQLSGEDHMRCITPVSHKDFAKDWTLQFLNQSDSFDLSSKETSMLIASLELELLEQLFTDLSFVLNLLKSRLHPKDVPKFALALKPTLFRKIPNVTNASEMVEIADVLKRTLDLTSNWKTALQFTGEEIKLLTEFVYSLLGALASMDPVETYTAVSLCAGIFQTSQDVLAESEKPQHVPRIYTAVQGLMDLLSCWTSCLKVPAHCEVLRSMETLGNHDEFVACISSLGAMFDWLENCQRETEIPANLLKPLKIVVCTICRLPFFYSFLLVPSSVWEKDWNPVTSLDPNSLRFEVPVVPAHFLQDELTLKQFIFRIRTLGWISRQNFEEIWMSVLGVLSLRNEPDVREEEQHCITLVTCQAVKTLTVLLEQNILSPRAGNPVCRTYLHISRDPYPEFFTTEKGEKLRRVFDASQLGRNADSANLERLYCHHAAEYGLGQLSRHYIDGNLRSSSNSFQEVTSTDLESCVHFMVDLYMQWLHDPDTPYALVLDIFRSLLIVSDFFTDSIHFLWLLEQSLVFHKRILPEDPLCLEPALIGCVLKSAAFVQMDPETWEDVRKVAECSLVSSNVATRRTALHGTLYILQKYTKNPDNMDPSSLLNLVMDYVTKYLGSDNPGLEWHQSLLWASAFYCAENFASFQYRSNSIAGCVVQFAVNALLDSNSISFSMQRTILQGLERLCLGEKLTSATRRIINKEIINLVRNVNKPQLFEPSLRILLTLMYTDLPTMKENNPTSDPETMLAAMEWIGVLFHRLKSGNDAECGVLSDVLVSVVPDILPAADILNRLLAEFMSAEARVAKFLVPTLFQVFQNAKAEGQQSIVLEWILLSLSNFTRIGGSSALMGAWNVCCLFVAASANHWLKILFPFVSQPIALDNVFESQLFLTAVVDFSSQLDTEQRKSLVAIFHSTKDNSPLYLTAAGLLEGSPMI